MRLRNSGLKFAVFISLFCHIFCFSSIDLTFDREASGEDFKSSKIFFLGSILQETNYSPQLTGEYEHSRKRFNDRIFAGMAKPESSLIYELGSDLNKPLLVNLIDNKIAYFKSVPLFKIEKAASSIMFSPPMPYHFLLYFKDRQTAYMEVAFYISPEGKIVGVKRKISSGNPEVDLLIMRNFTHFLNLCKSNFALGSWRTVKINLSP